MVCARVYTHSYTRIYIYIYIRVCMYAYARVCVWIYTHQICIYIYIHIYIYIYIYIYLHTYVYVSICNSHTHTILAPAFLVIIIYCLRSCVIKYIERKNRKRSQRFALSYVPFPPLSEHLFFIAARDRSSIGFTREK
jgi:hypothetical protein